MSEDHNDHSHDEHDDAGNVKVVARFRPLNDLEKEKCGADPSNLI
jgi:hypothetical protein